jgi:eukaryotic-like serine/threonine-protein kinase
MTPELWQRLKPLYKAVLETPAGERAKFVAQACQDDRELQNELEALLKANDEGTGALDGPFIRFEELLAGPDRVFADGELIEGRFQIVRHLGAGGMGEVYEAIDLQLGRIALKTIRPGVTTDPQQLSRFKKEVQLARRVSSRHVCRIHELFIPEGPVDGPQTAFFTMEFLEGITLTDKVRKDGPLPWREARTVALEICSALRCIHEEGIIHRDLKGRNIMLASRKGTACTVLMDFGIAYELSQPIENISTALTMDGAIIGTPGYIAPEQFSGKEATPSTDVYALGVVLYECVTGQRPFSEEPQVGLSFARAKDSIRLSSIQPRVPRRFDEVVCRCLEYDPQRRYQTAKEVERALRDTSVFPWIQQRPIAMASAAISLVLILFSVLLIPAVGERIRGILFSSSQKHIAVLPLEIVGNSQETQAIGDGLMDSLAGKLSNLYASNKTLWVVPPSEVRARKVTEPASAMKEFGATIVVRGSFERNGQSAKLRLTLIDPKKTREIGFVEVENPSGDLAALQDEAVTRLGRLMNISIEKEPLRGAADPVTRAAYEDYLAGLGYFQRRDKVGNIDLAIATFQNAVKTDPHFALGFAHLAQAYILKYLMDSDPRWLELAKKYGRQASELDDRVPSTYVALGLIHELTGKPDLAIPEFQRAISLDPRNPEALAGIANSYKNAGRYADAETAYIKAAALRPDDWSGYNDLGIFYESTGRPGDAIVQFKRALQLTPDNSWLWANLGMAYMDFDDPSMLAEADKALKKSIAISPTSGAYSNLGILYLEMRRFRESVTVCHEAIKLDDQNYGAWYNLTAAYEWLKDEDNARSAREKTIELAERTVRENPLDAEAQATLAALYAKNGNKLAALEKIHISLALSPDSQYVLSQIADAYEQLGKRREAITFLKQALAHGLSRGQVKGDPEVQGLISEPEFSLSGT